MNGRSGSGCTGRSGEGGSSQGTSSPAGFTEHSTENKSLLENRMEPLGSQQRCTNQTLPCS